MRQLVITKLYDLANIIRTERNAQKMTQLDLARKARLGINTVALAERGKTTPSIENLASMAKALGYDEIVVKI